MRRRYLPLIVMLAAGIAGCGQKGALVLPETERAHKKSGVIRPPAASPAPAPPASPQH